MSSELIEINPNQDDMTIYYSKAINRYNQQKTRICKSLINDMKYSAKIFAYYPTWRYEGFCEFFIMNIGGKWNFKVNLHSSQASIEDVIKLNENLKNLKSQVNSTDNSKHLLKITLL